MVAEIPTREEFLEMVYGMRDDLAESLKKAEAEGSTKEVTNLRRLLARANKLIVKCGGQA